MNIWTGEIFKFLVSLFIELWLILTNNDLMKISLKWNFIVFTQLFGNFSCDWKTLENKEKLFLQIDTLLFVDWLKISLGWKRIVTQKINS